MRNVVSDLWNAADWATVLLTTGLISIALALAVYISADIRRADTERIVNEAVVEDVDCSDFDTWEQARDRFLEHSNDVYGLDLDRDSVPCESLLPEGRLPQ